MTRKETEVRSHLSRTLLQPHLTSSHPITVYWFKMTNLKKFALYRSIETIIVFYCWSKGISLKGVSSEVLEEVSGGVETCRPTLVGLLGGSLSVRT